MMSEYPKIETLYVRDTKTFKVTDEIRKEEFKSIKNWTITEKIDGTNIRIHLDKEGVLSFGGRTERAQLPAFLWDYLQKTFIADKLKEVFWIDNPCEVTLYSEGYGNKIQKDGEKYIVDGVSIILFDAIINNWWLERKTLEDIVSNLGIKIVPSLGVMTIDEAVKLIGKKSEVAADKDFIAEGIVATSFPFMLYRNRYPIKWKLKVKDFLVRD